MWGTLKGGSQAVRSTRFIPTHVGNTTIEKVTRNSGAVHPHACGEHIIQGVSGKQVDGSSPRMWGTLRGA